MNTEVNIKMWAGIIDSGRYMEHDWLVKADVDTVFFPARLREILSPFRLQPCGKMYLRQTYEQLVDSVKMFSAMFGPLEVVSAELVRAYASESKTCQARIERRAIGEDSYLQRCFDLLNATTFEHNKLLDNFKNWERNSRRGKVDRQDPQCRSWYVAYHPLKTEASFVRCSQQAKDSGLTNDDVDE